MRILKNRKIIIVIVLVIASTVIYLSLSTFKDETSYRVTSSQNKINSSRIIFNFFRNGGIIIYPSSGDSKRLLEIGTKISSRFRNSKLKVQADTGLTKSEIENSNIILLGSYKSNNILHLFNNKLPVKFGNCKFYFLNHTYGKPSDLIDFIYPNPFNKQKGLIIISGNNDSLITANFAFNFSGDLRISDGSETELLTNFVKDTDDKWKVDSNNFWNFENQTDTILTTPDYTYISHSTKITKKEVDSVAAFNENSIASLKKLFGKSFKTVHISYNLYDSLEQKGLIINNTEISSYIESNESVHSVINYYIHGDDFTQDAILLLRENFGKPKSTFLETGMSVYLARNWRGFDYKFWANKLFLSDNVSPLSELLNNKEAQSESDLLTQPLAGTFAEFLIQKFGINRLTQLYPNWSPGKAEVESLNKEWLAYLSKLSESYLDKIKEKQKKIPSNIPKFLKGFSYAHVGYDIYNGYLSTDSYNSLKELKKIGVNAISIMPFTSIRNPNEPEPLNFWQSAFAENDESLIFLKEAAEKLNFVVMLKPQIWLRRGWTGDIKMNNRGDWNKFFSDYYRWIRHYALLAEMYGIPILCIGNEFSNATIGHEDKWIQMVQHIRKLYDGKITYGANWNNEFDKLNFWKYFDYIGISEYYPLSKKENPGDAELQTGADSVINLISSVQKKFGKSVLFTEIGFKSSTEPWQTALENNPQSDSTAINQARCYQAILKASYGKKWLAGMFWWKWPSYLGYADNPERDLYVPLNKPAENVVKKWYSLNWNDY